MKYDDVVEFFLYIYLEDIKKENEVPNINFQFKDEATCLFKEIMKRPASLIKQKDLDNLINSKNEKCINIKIHNHELFFKLLTEIINETIRQSIEGNKDISIITLLRRIWLRMGIYDVENIELFLKKQLEFLTDKTFNIDELTLIDKYDDCDIYMKTSTNETWDETPRSMNFIIYNKDGKYVLPRILYGIDSEGACYIYGVQSNNDIKNKKIEKKLYRLNDGIDNPNIHPSKVLSMLLFINQLENKGIRKIIVPSIQVLSYRYHELLSKEASKYKDTDHSFYERFYNKQDLISHLKTEDLINLMYRITEHKRELEIINDIDIQGDCLIIKNNGIKTKKYS